MKYLLLSLSVLSLQSMASIIPLSTDLNSPSSVRMESERSSGGAVNRIEFNLKKVSAELNALHPEFQTLSEPNIGFTQDVGMPSVPFKSVIVVGKPSEIEVMIDEKESTTVKMIPSPSQVEDCRCETPKKVSWVNARSSRTSFSKMDYLGKFRGQDLTRVTVYAATTSLSDGSTTFYPNLEARIFSKASLRESLKAQSGAYDLLIVTPTALLDGLAEYVDYKTRAGAKVKVVKLEDIGADVAKITAFFKDEYTKSQYKYALIVGTDVLFPNHRVNTSGSSQTPSDYPYFLMDSLDRVPDVHYGRVVASTAEEVARQTKKWMDYQDRHSPAAQYLKMIGIASNEGSGPSDNEYIQGMEADMKAAYNTTSTHFYQNDPTSKPQYINKAFEDGAAVLVYVGHGSGVGWGSTGTSYNVASIKQMNNARVLKPMLIDVACQNGTLRKGYFGETWLNATNSSNESIGAAMYYGGSVNVSWHPPAIMARGIVKKAISDRINVIGDALLAGQLYLMENYTDMEAVQDNFEWYHLFGDPSASVYFH